MSIFHHSPGAFTHTESTISFFPPKQKPTETSTDSSMASRLAIASRYVSRRFSSGSGKVLSEEEKAAENVYIKKIEKEKLEKLAHKGSKPEGEPAASSGGSVTDVKISGSSTSSTGGVSAGKNRNYAILAGVVTAFGALGWYLNGSAKKPEEVQD